MGWADLNRQLSYMSDGLQFGLDMMATPKEGENIFDQISKAGMNLFGNTMATQNAAELRDRTGSNLGYIAKISANGNGQQALLNTTQATMWTHQMDMMYNPRMCHSSAMWDMYSMPQAYMFNQTSYTPGFDVFNNNSFFRQNGGWFV